MKNLKLNIFKRIYYYLIWVKYIYRDLNWALFYECSGTKENKIYIYKDIFNKKPELKYIFKVYIKDNAVISVNLDKQKIKEEYKI